MPQDAPVEGPLVAASDAVAAAVGGWPGATVRSHASGGRAFHLGAREFGHVHRSGLVDVNFNRRVRDALVAAGRTRPHTLHPDSGWTSYRLRGPASVDGAVWLLRLAYLSTAVTLSRTRPGRHALAAVDLAAELAALDPPAPVAAVYLDRARALGVDARTPPTESA